MNANAQMEQSHKEFCRNVIELTKCYAAVCRLKNKVVDGEHITKEEIHGLDVLSSRMNTLLIDVEGLQLLHGYESVGFPFMEDANFNGFSIKDGELVGDITNAYFVAEPWFCDFVKGEKTSESDCFKFFIASFIIYMTDMLCPQVLEEVMRREVARQQVA